MIEYDDRPSSLGVAQLEGHISGAGAAGAGLFWAWDEIITRTGAVHCEKNAPLQTAA